jgi:hypothetical protein
VVRAPTLPDCKTAKASRAGHYRIVSTDPEEIRDRKDAVRQIALPPIPLIVD